MRRLLLLAAVLTAPLAAPSQAQGQRSIRLGTAGQLVSQDGPLGGFSGYGLVVSTFVGLGQWLGVRADGDFAALRAGDQLGICIPVDGGCLAQPGGHSLVGLTGAVELRLPLPVSPFVAVGPTYRRAVGGELPGGSRRAWLEPSVETGARIALGGVEWSLSARWRWSARWPDRDSYSELGLLVGLRF